MNGEALHAHREARRRAVIRRRRMAALLAAVAALAAVAVLVLAARTRAPSHAAGGTTHSTLPRGSAPARSGAGPLHSTAASGGSGGRPGEQPVPILMYHVIAPAPAGAPFPGLYVPPEEFATQMHGLASAGWHAVTLDQVEAYWRGGTSLGAGKPIVLTFDNGYQSQYTQALPVLRQLGWVADENIQLTGLPPSQGGLGSKQVQGLLDAGWELDTQGVSHADLVTLDAEQLRYQVAGARATLQQRYHVPVNWFCYPSGQYDASVIAAVKAAGYTGSTTVIPGWAHPADDPYRLHRLRVLAGTSATSLLAQIAAIRSEPPAPAAYVSG